MPPSTPVTSRSDGLVLIDKPAGVTSQQAVSRARRSLGGIRAGHTGTLDPFATGLLLVLIGRATRLAAFVDDEPKEYETLIAFGHETDTDDATGEVQRSASPPDPEAVREQLSRLTGDIEQQPPAYSAKHVAGERAYKLARRGVSATLAPVAVRVMQWEVLQQTADTLRARITCSGGTYIRALARDLGRLTGSAAHCRELRRLAAGTFRVERAVAPDAVTTAHVLPPQCALPSLPQQRLDAPDVSGVRQGRAVAARVAGDRAVLFGADDEFIALAERSGDHWLPRVVFPAA